MALLMKTVDDATHVEIDGELTIYTVADLAAQLLPALGGAPRMEIDLAQVTEVDGAGLQLLMLLRREAARAGAALTVPRQSETVSHTLELCNLVDAF
ncbi:MAG TPA: STAS domain-containing protein [Pseudomonas sp.]|jgi:anti-anti-sigma factor